jgi:uncharacterized protein involved in response to NO
VVGGYLMTRLSAWAVAGVLCAWLAGRLAFLGLALPPAVEGAMLLAYPACLFVFGGLPFVRAAKTWHNRIFGPLVAGFAAAELAYLTGLFGVFEEGESRGLVLGLDLVTLLLFVMGGRVIGAATSGAIQHKGGMLRGVAQARLEWLGVFALLGMTVLDLAGRLEALAAAAALVAAGAVVLRLTRWRVWEVADLAEVASLHLGYGWLAVGLALKAASGLIGVPSPLDAFHGVAVGAIGTLTLAMMARVSLQRSRRPIAFPASVIAALALITAAAVLRILAAFPETRMPMIEAAAVCWTAAFVVFTVFLARLFLAAPRPSAAEPA